MSDFHKLVEDVRSTFDTGRTKNIEWRIQQLKQAERMLVENEDRFLAALKSDLNKPKQDAYIGEIDFLKNDVISLLRHIQDWTKDQVCDKSPLTLFDTVLMHPEPFGTALVIGAWNFPLHLTFAPVLPAIAAGNCVIMKPSEISPATARALEDLVPKYLDPKCIKVVCGGVEETTELLKEKFDYIFYTGSTMVGRIVGAAANKHLTPCTLELGGKSPAFIDNSGNLEFMLKRLCWGKFNNCGQICVAPDYVLCSKEVEKKMIPLMKKILKEWYSETPEISPDYCRIVSSRHLSRLQSMLTQTSGNVVIGGKTNQEENFMEPTVVTGVNLDDPIMKEEIFGPILPIVNVESVDEAIKIINGRDKPLAMYVFTDRENVQEMFKKQTSSGGLAFNETIMHLSIEELPFGGVGASGMGSYHGKHGFDTFTHYKPILKKELSWFIEKLGEMRYPPYDEKMINMIRTLTKNRALPSFGWLKTGAVFVLGAAVGYAAHNF